MKKILGVLLALGGLVAVAFGTIYTLGEYEGEGDPKALLLVGAAFFLSGLFLYRSRNTKAHLDNSVWDEGEE